MSLATLPSFPTVSAALTDVQTGMSHMDDYSEDGQYSASYKKA